MPDTKGVVGALAARRKGRKTVFLFDGNQSIAPTGEDLVWIRLVPHVPHEPIVRRVVDVVQRHSELHRAKARREVSTAGRHRVDQIFAQLSTHLAELLCW